MCRLELQRKLEHVQVLYNRTLIISNKLISYHFIVMALEKIPADIRAVGGVARMSDPKIIKEIVSSVTIPVRILLPSNNQYDTKNNTKNHFS